MSKECLLQVQNVTKRYGDKIALNDFSYGYLSGRNRCIDWREWSWKNNTIELLFADILDPVLGQVQYKGENIIEKPLTIREFGILIEPQF